MASDRLLAPSISKATGRAALMVSASGVVTETSFSLRDRIGPAEDGSGGGAMRRLEEPSSPVNSIQNMPPAEKVRPSPRHGSTSRSRYQSVPRELHSCSALTRPKTVKWKYFDPSRRIASASTVTVH